MAATPYGGSGAGLLTIVIHTTMALRDWSRRRLLAAWGIGLGVQVALIAAPIVLLQWHAARELPRLRREIAASDERMAVAERADSLSRAAQRATAIAAGEFTVTPAGDTVVALVGMPSGRPSEAHMAAVQARMARRGQIVGAVLLGGIPFLLVGLTGAWVLARRRASTALGAA